MKIQRQLTTKSGRQIKAAVSSTLMQIKENEKITDPEKHSASFLWNELFQSVFGHDAEMKAIVEKHHDAFESFFSDKAEEVEFEDGRNREVKLAREEREIAGVPKQAEVDIPEIYRYLAALSSRKNKTLPRLNIATRSALILNSLLIYSSALLVELLEEIEREADDVVSPNLHDELNKRYAATLTNRRYVPFLDSQRKGKPSIICVNYRNSLTYSIYTALCVLALTKVNANTQRAV